MDTDKEAKLYLLSLVRDSIERAQRNFICNALDDYCLSLRYEHRWEVCARLKRYIRGCLGGLATVEYWLFKRHKNLMRAHGVTRTADLVSGALRPKVRQVRLDWIDHMVKLVEADQL